MSIHIDGNKRALRRQTSLPSAHNAFTICGFAKLVTAAPGREATIAYTQTAVGALPESAETVFLAGPSGTGLRAGDNYNTSESADVATVTAGGASGTNWFFWALVGLGTGANGLRLYHGAVGSGSLTYVSHTNTAGTGGFVAIQFGDLPFGDGTAGNTFWFNGLLAHVKVYNRALNESELTSEAGQGAPVSTSNLISYHSFSNATLATALVPDQGSGTLTVFDGASGNPATSTDMPVFSSTPTLTGDDTLPTGTTIAPSIVTTALPAGVVGTAYSQLLRATGDVPITWAVATGTLPSGLSLNTATGTISGTPSSAGTSIFTVSATNASGSALASLSVAVTAASAAPVIQTTSLVAGRVGDAYTQPLVATGTAPITWAVTNGTLPAGLALDAATGVIAGTPQASGSRTFTLSATNGTGAATQTYTLTVDNVLPPPADPEGWVRVPRDAEVWIRMPRAE